MTDQAIAKPGGGSGTRQLTAAAQHPPALLPAAPMHFPPPPPADSQQPPVARCATRQSRDSAQETGPPATSAALPPASAGAGWSPLGGAAATTTATVGHHHGRRCCSHTLAYVSVAWSESEDHERITSINTGNSTDLLFFAECQKLCRRAVQKAHRRHAAFSTLPSAACLLWSFPPPPRTPCLPSLSFPPRRPLSPPPRMIMSVAAYAPPSAPLPLAVATARRPPSRRLFQRYPPPPPTPRPGWPTGAAAAVATASEPVGRRRLLVAAAAAAAAAAGSPQRPGCCTATAAPPLPSLPLPSLPLPLPRLPAPSAGPLSSVPGEVTVASDAAIAATAARLRAECGPFLDALVAGGGLPPAGHRPAVSRVPPPLAYRGATAGDDDGTLPPAAAVGDGDDDDAADLVAGARHVHPAPDLLDVATYGTAGAAYFGRLDRLLAAAGLAVTPRGGHLLTGDPAAAAVWGPPATVWPVGAFSYVWWPRGVEVYTPADAATLLPPPPLPPPRDGVPDGAGFHGAGEERAAAATSAGMAAAAAAADRVADAKGPLFVDTGLACALATGHEVLFVSAGGWWEVPAAASPALALAVFREVADGEGEVPEVGANCPS